MSLLSVFSFESSPVVRFGWYGASTPLSLNEVFSAPAGNSQTVNPTINGVTRFEPAGATFGLYASFPHQAHGPVYSQDALNTWDAPGSSGHKIRFFPYRKPNGAIQPNTYVIAFDEATDNIDFQDGVLIISNVVPA
jgi:hypothetical protein